MCACCKGPACPDEGYTLEGQIVCLSCYHEEIWYSQNGEEDDVQ